MKQTLRVASVSVSSWARLVGSLVAVALVAGCGSAESFEPPAPEDPGPIHVHALGVDPADGALFVATHTGLWRLGEGDTEASRVTDRRQDTMGFTVVGPGHFLGSGHPDLRDELPPHLGLIESRDAGRTWNSISLLGEADFHVLRTAAGRIFGFDATNARLLVSENGGASWEQRPVPAPLLDLVVDPENPNRLLGAVGRGLVVSENGGATWSALDSPPGLLAWPAAGDLYVVDVAGRVFVSPEPAGPWSEAGAAGCEPAAFHATGAGALYVALHDGPIVRSVDGGASWSVLVATEAS